MKLHTTLFAIGATLLLGFSPPATAGAEDEAKLKAAEAERMAAEVEKSAEETARQAELKAEYQAALASAEAERGEAQAAIAEARAQLEQAAQEEARSAAERERARAAQEAEMQQMYEELNRARRELAATSREVARINREVARERARAGTGKRFIVHTAQKPVIGVILGDSDDSGIEVIGVTPDGPAETAGIEQGDVIIAMGGVKLAGEEAESDVQLQVAKETFKAGEPVVISYMRAGKTVDVEIVPEVREPYSWHTVTRFPSIESPEDVVMVERIVVPEIDTAELAERIAQVKVEVAERARLAAPPAPNAPERVYDIEFHELSELGDLALLEANVWFGLPLTRGLKLAEIEPGLGEYFKTDRGVLVLKAREDNELQLESGDVILKVSDSEVDSPADFMRALREAEPGEELVIDIKRDRKNKTLKPMMPERKGFGYFLDGHPLNHDFEYSYKITTD